MPRLSSGPAALGDWHPPPG